MEEQKEKHASIKTPLLFMGFIGFSFLIYIVGVVVGVNFGQQNAKIVEKIVGSTNESELCATLIPEEPEELYAYTGFISEKGENFIIINLNIIEDQAVANKKIKVLINAETKINKINLQSIPDEEGNVPEEVISLDKIMINDNVTASANENIKDKEEFTASSITRIIN